MVRCGWRAEEGTPRIAAVGRISCGKVLQVLVEQLGPEIAHRKSKEHIELEASPVIIN